MQLGFQRLSRYSVHVQRRVFRICIIGSGPAGLYTAQKLLKSIPLKDNATTMNIEVDLIERLPAPYGLVRYGVAPDHPEVKVSN